jgi:hypothetical protein
MEPRTWLECDGCIYVLGRTAEEKRDGVVER